MFCTRTHGDTPPAQQQRHENGLRCACLFYTRTHCDTLPAQQQPDTLYLLAAPARGPINASITNGASLFASTGCALCHTPSLQTSSHTTVALSNKPVNLYSDLVVHNMGSGLSDGISQGGAGPMEFRTAPLWGLGQRIFFLHDGRSSNLLETIRAHSSTGSEANNVIDDFNALTTSQTFHNSR